MSTEHIDRILKQLDQQNTALEILLERVGSTWAQRNKRPPEHMFLDAEVKGHEKRLGVVR